MSIFRLKNVNYKNIIRYPNIEIQQGCTTFISGESGSGKSTLLKLLNGITSPTSGEIFYLDKNITDYTTMDLRREILLVSQQSYLFDMSIRDNFQEYYAYRELENICNEQMQYFLKICAVDNQLDDNCNVMSGGERQRIFTAINLSFPSKVLMLDEPVSALDHKNANTLMSNIKTYCKEQKKKLIVVSHDKTLMDKYADEIINISKEKKNNE
ncbi:MAG: ATP-binding cassette domain-containing protein [Dysgonamonadaceae bacterium]|jgi:putative ABC transport system ATP-binding protein|nr:ATP-binding cassette domain-containing protein [Dysgonamonadaceae bacterium]